MDANAFKRMDFSRYPRRDLARDDSLFFEGDDSRELYVLLTGSLGVFRDEVLIATLDEPLTVVGEVSALTGEPRGATVRALRRSTLVEVALPDALFAEYPQMGAKLARVLASRLQAMNQRFVALKLAAARGAGLPPVMPPSSHTESSPKTLSELDPEMFDALTSILDFNPDTT